MVGPSDGRWEVDEGRPVYPQYGQRAAEEQSHKAVGEAGAGSFPHADGREVFDSSKPQSISTNAAAVAHISYTFPIVFLSHR